jgi:hypothetical protein
MFPPNIPPAVDDPPIIFLIGTQAYILANFRRPSGYEQSLDLCVRERKQTYRTQYVTPVIANENRGLEERTKEVAEDRSETKLAHTLGTLQKKSARHLRWAISAPPPYCSRHTSRWTYSKKTRDFYT